MGICKTKVFVEPGGKASEWQEDCSTHKQKTKITATPQWPCLLLAKARKEIFAKQ